MAINRDKVLQEAQKLVDKKRYDKAIVEYQKVVAEDPSDVRTLLKIGDLHLKLEQFAEAISLYERVGQHYSAQGFSVKAVAVYKQIREIIQKHVPHLEDRFGHIVPKLAELLTQLGLTSDALMYYDELATRFQRLGRERDAIDVFRKIVSLDPQNPLSHLRLADAFVRVRDLDGAVDEYAQAGEILMRIGRADDALRVVDRILMHRQDAKYARLAAEIYLSRGQPNDGMAALTKLQLCFKEDPRDLETLALLARAFEALGQPAKAIEVQKEAARIARDAGKMDAFNALLQVLIERAPNDEGVTQLQMASSAPPSVMPGSSVTGSSVSSAMPGFGNASRQQSSAGPASESIEVMADDLEVIEGSRPNLVAVEEEEPPFQLRSSQPPPLPGVPETPAARVRQILMQVEAFRHKGDYHHAVLTLQTGVSALPSARELREKLCDLLIESGDQEQAIVEMLGFATYLAQSGDDDGAARLLDEVLLLDPQNEAALAMLGALGYAIPEVSHVDEGYSPPQGVPLAGITPPGGSPDIEYADPSAYSPEPFSPDAFAPEYGSPGYAARGARSSEPEYAYGELGYPDPSEPLPSYDLEGTDDVLSSHVAAPHAAPPHPPTGPANVLSPAMLAAARARPATGGAPVVQLDDPFQGEALPYGYDADADGRGGGIAPPPDSFRTSAGFVPPAGFGGPAGTALEPPLEEMPLPQYESYEPGPLPAFPIDEPTHYGLQVDPSSFHAEMPSRGPEVGQLDESALEEMEFFQSHGMFDEARGILTAELGRLPNHPLLLERKRELDALSAAPVSVLQRESSTSESQPVDRSFDIASALGGLDALGGMFPDGEEAADELGATEARVAPPRAIPQQPQQVSVETVFEQFKAGVAAQVAESDAATHYDLGVAYKEMGLVTDAIAEFELASRDPMRECVAQSMIGMLHMEQNDVDRGIDAFIRGLTASQKSSDQELALTYEIGNAYEIRQNREQALYYFQLVARIDPNYRDPRGSVEERTSNLEERRDPAPRAAAVGGSDEFDAAFDDLFDGKPPR